MKKTTTRFKRVANSYDYGQTYSFLSRFYLLLISWIAFYPLSTQAQSCQNSSTIMAWDFDAPSNIGTLNLNARISAPIVSSTTVKNLTAPNGVRAIGSSATSSNSGSQNYAAQLPLRDIQFVNNSPNAARFTMHISEGTVGYISALNFEKTSYRISTRMAGSDPCGVRILRDGVEIFKGVDYPNPANTWTLREIPLNIKLDGKPTTLTFEILGYGTQTMLNQGGWVWALDNVKVLGCWCKDGKDQNNSICESKPISNDNCAIPANILKWTFNDRNTADIKRTADVVAPIIDPSTVTTLGGTYQRAAGSMMSLPVTGLQDYGAQFRLRETQFVPNSPNAARFTVHIKAGTFGKIKNLQFEKVSYQITVPTRGADPCGVRVLKDGKQVFLQSEIPVETNVWLLRNVPMDIELDGKPTTLTFEILGYGTQTMVNQGTWVWAIDNIALQGCWCAGNNNQDNITCNSQPISNDTCAIPANILKWTFNDRNTAGIKRTADVVAPIVDPSTVTTLGGTYQRAAGSMMSLPATGLQDYGAQFRLRETQFVPNSPNAARFTVHIKAGTFGKIRNLQFEKVSYQITVPTRGADPCGVRVLKDGKEVFLQSEIPVETNVWLLRNVPMDIELDGKPTTLTFEILGYGTQTMVNQGTWVWAIDNIALQGCWCAGSKNQDNITCNSQPISNDTCGLPANILKWSFNDRNTADIKRTADVVAPIISPSTVTTLIGNYQRAAGSMMYMTPTGLQDYGAQFPLRETQFVPNSPNAARFSFHVKNGVVGHIKNLKFEKNSYQVIAPTRGADPCGVRILKNGTEIFRATDLPVASNVWLLREVPLNIELDGRPATYIVEILGYGTQTMVNQGNWFWAIDNIALQGCWCFEGKNQEMESCHSTCPIDSCSLSKTILNWNFDQRIGTGNLNRNANSVAKSIVAPNSFLGLTGTYQRAAGSMMYVPESGSQDNAAQFALRETQFVPNSPNAARFSFHAQMGVTGMITGIQFEKNSYRVNIPAARGADPCGVRILKNGNEIFKATDMPLDANVWTLRHVPLEIDLDGKPDLYTIEILGYGTREMITQGGWVWAIDNITLKGVWNENTEGGNAYCPFPAPSEDSCAMHQTILGWNFNAIASSGTPNRNATEVSPIIDLNKTVLTFNGTYQLGANGSSTYSIADGQLDRSAQFVLRETQFVDNSVNAARFTFHTTAGSYGRISALRFDKSSYRVIVPTRGADPCGVRILKNGVEIFKATDLPVETDVWLTRHIPLNIELDGKATTYTIEILGYGTQAMINQGGWVWAIDNVKLLGCWCSNGKNQLGKPCPALPEPPAGSCERPNAIVAWNFNNTTAQPNTTASTFSSILSSTTSKVIIGSTTAGPGSGTVLPATGVRDNGLQFPIRHSSFVEDSPNAARFTLNIKNGTVGTISALRFEKISYLIQAQPVRGGDPCGVRILKNGQEIARATDLPVAENVWLLRQLPLNIELDGSPCTITFEILGYGTPQMVAARNWFWAIDNIEVLGCWCSEDKDQNNKPCMTLVANNDNVSTTQNNSVTVNPLSNDVIPAGCRFNGVKITQQPINGTVTQSGNNFIYTPNNGFTGNDAFRYIIMTSCGNSNEGIVNITVTAPEKGSISGILYNDNNNNGIYDEGDTPISGVQVTLCDASQNTLKTAVSSSTGVYTFADMLAGAYFVKFTHSISGNRIIATQNPVSVNLNGGQNLTGINGGYKLLPVLPTISISDVTVNENDGIARVPVCLSAVSDSPVTFSFTTNSGTATSPNDYITRTGSITIPAGQTCANISIQITDDLTPELLETFSVDLTNAIGATILEDHSIVKINDNDSAASPVAKDDNVSTPHNTTVAITPLDNDIIPTSCKVQYLTVIEQPNSSAGTATVKGTKIEFVPVRGFYGTATFSYSIQTSCGTSNIAKVTVNVQRPVVDCNEARNNTITKSCVNGSPELTGTILAGYEYQWMMSTKGCPNDSTSAVPGANAANYTINGKVSQNTYFIRCARPIGCTNWDAITESNCVLVTPTDCDAVAGCDAVSVIGNDNGTITVNGLSHYTSQIIVFNSAWQPIFNQQYASPTAIIPAKTGSYIVKVVLYNTDGDWELVCEKVFENISVTGGLTQLANKNVTLSLLAKANLHNIKLNWVNNSGNQNDYFEIEKLNKDLGIFEKIETVNSTNTTNLEHYSTSDNNPNDGENVYRIALTKLDGTKTVSNETVVKFSKTFDFGIFPNPASDYVEVDLKQYEGKAVSVYIYNQVGTLIMSQKVEKASSSPLHFDVSSKVAGQYLIRVAAEGRKEVTKVFMIQN